MNLKTKHTTHVRTFQTFYLKNRWNRSKPIPRPHVYIIEPCPGTCTSNQWTWQG